MAFIIQPVEQSHGLIRDFFSDRPDLAYAFISLQEYIHSLDDSIVLRLKKGEIIGVSQPESVFHFYVSHKTDEYKIKFKHIESAIPFSTEPEQMDFYKGCCDEVTERILNGDWPIKGKAEKNAAEPHEPTPRELAVAELNETLQACSEIFNEHSAEKINLKCFSNHAKMALEACEINTYGDLLEITAEEFLQVNGVGNKCILKLAEGCRKSLDLLEGKEIKPTRAVTVKENEPDNSETAVHFTGRDLVGANHDFSEIIDFLHNILEGIDPFTGEVFDRREMYNYAELAKELTPLSLIVRGRKKPESRNILNRPSDKIFNDLKAWRKDKAEELNVPPYIIFSDDELWSIAEGDVCTKEELLLVKGISTYRYENYGDDIFEILSDYIENNN